MYGVNLDLLRASSAHHPDGRPIDPHAQHRAEHLATLRAERRGRWLGGLARFRRTLLPAPAPPVPPGPVVPATS